MFSLCKKLEARVHAVEADRDHWRTLALSFADRFRLAETDMHPSAYSLILADNREYHLFPFGKRCFLLSLRSRGSKETASIQLTTWEEWSNLVEETKPLIEHRPRIVENGKSGSETDPGRT